MQSSVSIVHAPKGQEPGIRQGSNYNVIASNKAVKCNKRTVPTIKMEAQNGGLEIDMATKNKALKRLQTQLGIRATEPSKPLLLGEGSNRVPSTPGEQCNDNGNTRARQQATHKRSSPAHATPQPPSSQDEDWVVHSTLSASGGRHWRTAFSSTKLVVLANSENGSTSHHATTSTSTTGGWWDESEGRA